MPSLPPRRHPAWLMVSIIGCAGAALVSWIVGSAGGTILWLIAALLLALGLAAKLNRERWR